MPSWIYTRAQHTVHKRNTHTRALGQNTHIDAAATSAHNTHVQQNLDMYSNINTLRIQYIRHTSDTSDTQKQKIHDTKIHAHMYSRHTPYTVYVCVHKA